MSFSHTLFFNGKLNFALDTLIQQYFYIFALNLIVFFERRQ